MRVGAARAAAADWVMRNASREAGFQGAYFSGSTIGMPDDAELPRASDVDVVLVIADAEPPMKLGKFIYHDALLEVTYLSSNQLASAEDVLASIHLAGSFRTDTIIADPTGRLRTLQQQVSRHFAEPAWVRRRCEKACQGVEAWIRAIDSTATWHEQVTVWLFGNSMTSLVPILAALRNPTVRKRYLAARDVLTDYHHTDVYEQLLTMLGCIDMTPARADEHVDALSRTFDAADAVARTPYRFRSDISAAARPIAIDGSRELIQAGNHREAVFWIVATFARCHTILALDAPELQRAHAPAFDAVVADLGIHSSDDLRSRGEAVIKFLPRLWETAEDIMSVRASLAGGVRPQAGP
jgi:hypothetical protein